MAVEVEVEEIEVSCGAPLLPGLSLCHAITQPTRWITTTNAERTNTRHSKPRHTRHSRGSTHNQYPGITSYPNHVMYLSQPIRNLRTFRAVTDLKWSKWYVHQLIVQLKHRSLNKVPVGYCYAASILLFVEDDNTYSYNSFLYSTMIPSSSIFHTLSLDIRTYAVSTLQ